MRNSSRVSGLSAGKDTVLYVSMTDRHRACQGLVWQDNTCKHASTCSRTNPSHSHPVMTVIVYGKCCLIYSYAAMLHYLQWCISASQNIVVLTILNGFFALELSVTKPRILVINPLFLDEYILSFHQSWRQHDVLERSCVKLGNVCIELVSDPIIFIVNFVSLTF